MAQDVLGLGVELDGLAIDGLLERMPDQRLVLVMLDAHSMRDFLGAGLLGFVLPEQPIDGAVARDLRLLDRLALALAVPFI